MHHPWHHNTTSGRIRKLTVGPYENNVYVVACGATRRALIVDAAGEPERIMRAVEDVEPVAILTTHGHADHTGAAADVAAALGIPVLLRAPDRAIAAPIDFVALEPGPMELGDTTIEVRDTPGHTPGSVSVVVEGAVLTGDTLFPGGPGATRFPYSDFEQIMHSLREQLFTLGGDTLVFPGHGLDTTIGEERPKLGEWQRRGW